MAASEPRSGGLRLEDEPTGTRVRGALMTHRGVMRPSISRFAGRLALPGMVAALLALGANLATQEKKPLVQRQEVVIHGHKRGVALTLDFLPPHKPNGAGVIFIMSGGWVSRRDPLASAEARAAMFARLVERGYTLFLVYHGSQPKFVV